MSCGNQSTDLQSKGFYMIRVFARRYFWTDYNIVLFSKVAIKKCSSIVIPVAGSFLLGLQTVSLYFFLRLYSFAGVFMIFVCIYFTGASFDVSPVCVSYKIYQWRKSLILVASIRFYTLFTKLKLLCICLAVS